MSFIIMYNYATVIDILHSGCHYIILQLLVWKWHFDKGLILPLVRIWYVFIVDMLFSSSFFDSVHKTYVDIYLRIFECILAL